MRRCAAAVLLVASCHEPAPPHVPPVTSAIASPATRPVPPNEVVAPEGATAKGRLVITWRTAAEEREVASSGPTLAIIRHMVDRMTVSPADIDLAQQPRVPYALTGAPLDATPVAYFDIDHTFWETVQGGGKGLVGSGPAGGGEVKLVANPVSAAPKRERCEGERYKLLVIEDAQLGKRRFCAFLPSSWAREPKRLYPVVLLMPGFMSTDLSYVVGKNHAGDRLDVISQELSREAVLVGVDTAIPLGSTYLEDSPATGAWDTFLAKKALPVLDRELRIIPRRTAHALLGQSTGGYNALSYGLRHSDLFSAIGSSSPDPPDFEMWLLEPGTRRFRDWTASWARVEAAVGGAGQMTSWAAAWSPDPVAPRGFRYPIDLATGLADELVLARWVARSPHGLVRDPVLLARAKKDLSGRIMLIVGRNDDFDLFAPAKSFAEELNTLGVETRFVATDHGHADHLDRFDVALRFLLERLDRAK